jgi:hypothetical protein
MRGHPKRATGLPSGDQSSWLHHSVFGKLRCPQDNFQKPHTSAFVIVWDVLKRSWLLCAVDQQLPSPQEKSPMHPRLRRSPFTITLERSDALSNRHLDKFIPRRSLMIRTGNLTSWFREIKAFLSLSPWEISNRKDGFLKASRPLHVRAAYRSSGDVEQVW